jgi:hypothetical protein
VSGLVAILRIPENQIVIISVTEGSIIVELGFIRLSGANASPDEVVRRLKSAAASGELNQLEITELTIGQGSFFQASSETTAPADVVVVVSTTVGGIVVAILLAAFIWRWRRRQSQVKAQHDCCS